MRKLVLLLIIVIIAISAFYVPFEFKVLGDITNKEAKTIIAVRMSEKIKNLPEVNTSMIHEQSEVRKLVYGINNISGLMNDRMETNLSIIPTDNESIRNISKWIEKGENFIPMVNSYNNLIYVSKNVDSTNVTTINEFYKKSGVFSLELALLQANILYKLAYRGIKYFPAAMETMNITSRN